MASRSPRSRCPRVDSGNAYRLTQRARSRMKLEGEHTFPVSRPELWNALLDPDLLGRVLPGAEPLELVGENTYRAGMTVAIGPVKGRFQGTLALSDLVPPTSYQMKIDGSGPAGFLRGSGGIELGRGRRLDAPALRDGCPGRRSHRLGRTALDRKLRPRHRQAGARRTRARARRARRSEGAEDGYRRCRRRPADGTSDPAVGGEPRGALAGGVRRQGGDRRLGRAADFRGKPESS